MWPQLVWKRNKKELKLELKKKIPNKKGEKSPNRKKGNKSPNRKREIKDQKDKGK